MSYLECSLSICHLFLFFFFRNPLTRIPSTTLSHPTELYIRNIISNVETLSPCFPFWLSRRTYPACFYRSTGNSSCSCNVSLPLARFRIRIANETSNYHQRLPRSSPPSYTFSLSLSLSLPFRSHAFSSFLTFAISSRKQHRQVAAVSLYLTFDGNESNYLLRASLSSLSLPFRIPFFKQREVAKISYANCN